VEHVLLLGDS
jgi:hypothetical protein